MKKYLFIFFMLFIMPINVKALSLSLNCDKTTVNVGNNITCNVVTNEEISSQYKIIQMSAYEKNMILESATSSNLLNVSYATAIKGEISKIIPASSVLFTLKYKAETVGEGTISLFNISDDTNSITAPNIEKKITINKLSTNNYLSSISISNETIKFDKNITSYEFTTKQSSITINAVSEDSTAKISGLGTKNLGYGENVFDIICTSSSGETRVYSFKVTRTDNRNSDTTLKSLTLSNIDFTFKPSIYNYSLFTKESSVEIKAITNNDKATVSGTGKINLDYGNNLIELIVTAENENQKRYILSINRINIKNGNNNLSNIVLSSGSIYFNKNTLEYHINVENDVKEIEITPTVEVETSRMEYTKKNTLKVGENKITINVISENGDSKTYVLIINRLNENEKIEYLSLNNYLKELTIKGYKINFDKNKFNYSIKIDKDVEKLDISYITDDKKSSVKIEGNKNLSNGSVIKITVYAENGIYSTYKINIEKEIQEEKKINILYIVIPIIIIVSIITFIIIKKRKNNI